MPTKQYTHAKDIVLVSIILKCIVTIPVKYETKQKGNGTKLNKEDWNETKQIETNKTKGNKL